MTTLVDSFALWLADFYLLASVSLAIALTASACLKQPVQRLAVVKSTIVALFLLAALCALPGWSLIHLVSREQPRANGSPAPLAQASIATNADEPPTIVQNDLEDISATAPTAHSVTTDTNLGNAIRWPNISLPSAISITYITGAACGLAWLAHGALCAHQLRRTAKPAPTDLQALMKEATHFQGIAPYNGLRLARSACHWLRQCLPSSCGQSLPVSDSSRPLVELSVSSKINVAVALGVLRPVVLLPTNWLETQSRDELRAVLAHEAAHIDGGDLRWLAASRVLLVLLWAQPLYWLLRRRMRLDQETLADAAAADLTSRKRYAEQLVNWARNIPARPAVHISAAVGLWERPSQLRQRIALLVDEHFTVLRNIAPLWRRGATIGAVLAALLLSLVTLEPRAGAVTEGPPPIDDPRTIPTAAPVAGLQKSTESAVQPEVIPIIVAKHVMLHDGKIIEWADVKRRIAALPNATLAHPSFKFTNGAIGGREEEILAKIWDLRRRVELHGHSWGFLPSQTSVHYDAIRTAIDLIRNVFQHVDGIVETADGLPVEGAEVVLLADDRKRPAETRHVYLQNERLREPENEIVTHSNKAGQFTIYPQPYVRYYLVVLHREGFCLVRSDEFTKSRRIAILPWAHVKGSIEKDERFEQSATVTVQFADDWLRLNLYQQCADFDPLSPAGRFEINFVPPSLKGWLSRGVTMEGSTLNSRYKDLQLAPGETLTADIKRATREEVEKIERVREVIREHTQQANRPEQRSSAGDDQDAAAELRTESNANADAAAQPVEIPIIVAKQVMLHSAFSSPCPLCLRGQSSYKWPKIVVEFGRAFC